MAANAAVLQSKGWRECFLLLMPALASATVLDVRFESTTTGQLDETFPLAVCCGLDVLCGIALATSALTISSVACVVGGRYGRPFFWPSSIGRALWAVFAGRAKPVSGRAEVKGWN